MKQASNVIKICTEEYITLLAISQLTIDHSLVIKSNDKLRKM
jgi:hypothetical protein